MNKNELYQEFFEKVQSSGIELTPELSEIKQKIIDAPSDEPSLAESLLKDSKLNALEHSSKNLTVGRSLAGFWREYDEYLDEKHFGHDRFLAIMTDVISKHGRRRTYFFELSGLEYSVRNLKFWIRAGGRIVLHDIEYLICWKNVYDSGLIQRLVSLYYQNGGGFSLNALISIKKTLESGRMVYFQDLEIYDDPFRVSPPSGKGEFKKNPVSDCLGIIMDARVDPDRLRPRKEIQ